MYNFTISVFVMILWCVHERTHAAGLFQCLVVPLSSQKKTEDFFSGIVLFEYHNNKNSDHKLTKQGDELPSEVCCNTNTVTVTVTLVVVVVVVTLCKLV